MNKHSQLIGLTTFLLSAIGIFLLIVIVPPHLSTITALSQKHWILGALLIILWRIIAIVIPPVPGGIVSFALVPVFGWFLSFVYATIGVLIGTTIAFYLARRYQEPLVKRFVPLQQLHQWQGKLSKKTEFFAFLGIRLATAPVLDFISYIAGLSTIRFSTFISVVAIGILPDALIYYLGEELYKQLYKESAYLGVLSLLIFAVFLYGIGKIGFFEDKKDTQKKM